MALTRVISDLTEAELGMLRVVQNFHPKRTGEPASRSEAIRVSIRDAHGRIIRRRKE